MLKLMVSFGKTADKNKCTLGISAAKTGAEETPRVHIIQQEKKHMADLLKNMFNPKSLNEIAAAIRSVYPAFQAEEFVGSTMDETWDDLELKARVRKINISLGTYLPADYREALAVLDQVIADCPSGLFGILFPDFVEVYGQDEENWDLSIAALERYTTYSSSEFAVRPFIIHHEERMMAQMYAWSKHENEHVRRLASEGCRPQLPSVE